MVAGGDRWSEGVSRVAGMAMTACPSLIYLALALTGCNVTITQMCGPLSCFVGRTKLDTWARAFKASLDRNR